jgi:hypothetical protein
MRFTLFLRQLRRPMHAMGLSNRQVRSVPTIGYHAARSNLASQVDRMSTLISLNGMIHSLIDWTY